MFLGLGETMVQGHQRYLDMTCLASFVSGRLG